MKKNAFKALIISFLLILAAFAPACAPKVTAVLSADLFGSQLDVKIYDTKDTDILSHLGRLCKEYDLVLNPDNYDSELYAFNLYGGQNMTLSADMIQMLRIALFYYEMSDGMYDVTSYVLGDAWDFSGAPALPDDELLAEILLHVGLGNLSVSTQNASLASGASIDFGVLAKGYVLGVIKTELENAGVNSAVISLDGNTFVIGKPSGGKITLAMPFSGGTESLGTIKVSDRSVVSLSADGAYFRLEDKLYHSFFDPSTGYPADTDLYSVTVIADAPIRAYALSEICMRIGFYAGLELISSLNGVDAVFVTNTSAVHVTSGFTASYSPDFGRDYTEHVN